MTQGPTAQIPVFGTCKAGGSYLERPSAYAIIRNEKGLLAAVKPREFYFLPGGGIDSGETPEQALTRELVEELGWEIEIGTCVGEAHQYFEMPHKNFKMLGVFYEAAIVGEVDGQPEYQPLWRQPQAILEKFYHESHRWAVSKACGIR